MGNFISLNDRRKQRNRSALKKKSAGKLRLSVFRSGMWLRWIFDRR